MRDNPLLSDANRRHEELLEKLPEDTQQYQRSKAVVDKYRHDQLVDLAEREYKLVERGHCLQRIIAVIAMLTLIASIIACIIAIFRCPATQYLIHVF